MLTANTNTEILPIRGRIAAVMNGPELKYFFCPKGGGGKGKIMHLWQITPLEVLSQMLSALKIASLCHCADVLI